MNSPGFPSPQALRAALTAALLATCAAGHAEPAAPAAGAVPLAAAQAPSPHPATKTSPLLAAGEPAQWAYTLSVDALGPAPDPATLPPPPPIDPLTVLPRDADGCRVLFEPGDPRLFDFVHTRKQIDFRRFQGQRIRDMQFLTLPIFNEDDPEEDHGLYRLVNRLHTLTRMSPIRRQVLLRPGDLVVDDRIRESERILRGTKYLYDAMILPGRFCDDGIDLLVVVRDVWTLQLNASLESTGGQSSTSISLSEDNLFGHGHSLSLEYASNPARDSLTLGYESRHLIDGHTRLKLDYGDNSDGNLQAIIFERPFYSLETRWAAGISASGNELRQTIEANGVQTNEYDFDATEFELHAGVSTGLRNNIAHRFRGGFTRSADRYANQDPAYTDPLPADRVLAYPWIEYAGVENRYLTTFNFTQMFRNEDLQIGATWQARFGAADETTGATERAWIGRFAWTHTPSIGSNHLVQVKASADLFWIRDADRLENSVFTWEANYTHFLDERNRWYVLAQLDLGENLDPSHEFTAGGEVYLRGYPNYWQRGDRRLVANIERRHFFATHLLNLVRFGAAAFVDIGRALDSNDAIVQSDNVLSNVGIGLRFTSSKAKASQVLHMNIAFPLTDRHEAGDHQWSVYTETKF